MSDDQTFLVRRLLAADEALFRDMLLMFGKAFEEVDVYTGNQPSAEYLRSLLGGDQFIALAALDGEKVIGGLAAYELKKFEQERSEFYIYDLAVDAAHRRKGVAAALIDALKPIAVERGVHVIIIQAYKDDKPAVALYSKFSKPEDIVHFDIAPE